MISSERLDGGGVRLALPFRRFGGQESQETREKSPEKETPIAETGGRVLLRPSQRNERTSRGTDHRKDANARQEGDSRGEGVEIPGVGGSLKCLHSFIDAE